MDLNNNCHIEAITKDTVEAELEKLKLFDEDYQSDDEINGRDRVRLTGKGIDFRALQAGKEVEFELDEGEDLYNWEDESDKVIDYEKVFKHRNMDMVNCGEDDDEVEVGKDGLNESGDNGKTLTTPFERLREKMKSITPDDVNGVVKRVLENGSGLIIPNGSRVRVHYNAYFEMNDEPFDSTYLRSKTFEFKLGAGEVVAGLDIAVATMKKREKSQFIFEADYYCGKFGCPPRVPADTPVLFEIEIISFIEANAYDAFNVTPEEQRKKLTLTQMLQICNCLRELGNDNYARKLYREASKKYRKSIYLLENTNVMDDAEEIKWKAVMLKLNLNMSAVCLKQSKPKKCIFHCKQALDFEPQNVKSLFRYGQSLRILQDFDRSKKFLMKAYKLAPSNMEIAAEIEKLNEMVGKYNMIEKDTYKRMFNNAGSKAAVPAIESAESRGEEFIIAEKESLAGNRPIILGKLKEFIDNEKLRNFTVRLDSYSLDIINFLIAEAEKAGLVIRHIKGSTNILQVMKKS